MRPEFIVILAAFAAHRISRLICIDDGPYRIFKLIRLFFGRRARNDHHFRFWWSMGELFTCPYCIGIWVSAIIALILFPIHWFPLYWFGIAGMQAFIYSFDTVHE